MAVERQLRDVISPSSGDVSEGAARRRTRPESAASPAKEKSLPSPPELYRNAEWHTARPKFIFSSRCRMLSLFLLLDFLIYLERGIVPGAHEELAHFLVQNATIRRHPEVYFGLLQSVFIGGLAITAPILSFFAAKTSKPVPFLALGLGLWLISIFGCAVAGALGSISLLFVSRTLSGAGEGAFIGLMAPVLLDCNTEAQRGTFLGLFYGLMPAGMALGFIVSAVLASIFRTWYPAFGLLFLASIVPILFVIVFALTPASHGASPFKHLVSETRLVSAVDGSTDAQSSLVPRVSMAPLESSPLASPRDGFLSSRPSIVPDSGGLEATDSGSSSLDPEQLSFSECVGSLVGSPVFLALLLSGASQSAVSASLASFGSAFLLDLRVFPTEVAASSVIGLVGACTGALGTFAGGLLTDLPLQKLQLADSAREIELVTYTPSGRSKRWAAFLRDRLCWPGEDFPSQIKRIISVRLLTPLLTALAFVAAFLLSFTPVILHAGGSNVMALSCLTFGLLCLFMTQSGLNYCVMSCAPHHYRSLAISVFTLGLHLVGDVPGPIVVGFLKDRLAPHCSQPVTADNDLSLQCEEERGSLLLTLFIFLSWSHCIWLGMYLASKVTKAAALPVHHPSLAVAPLTV
eukprot:Gregarina_sp_Pseudo_9__5161@NODE_551_length_2595_cov_390_769562_g9_i1_p1_GENE_NODE_551_length_2595_cov_390_769562_g9_i1NODE_551_length_2595_cov_390_769562_g9_i1_p1_ORF_typecomplete_len633_score111_47MFS_1/PF07690_16/1_2e27OATP/PF03137_20/1_7e14OATP/PF03137_20/7_1e06OATP/PF03137_20/3_1e03Sugar_tr/PF00083_24/2_2e06Sugar_tr/PF00083_24/3_8e02Sugar_tr/PF00083_24/58Sugar_tr/PF00083_24/5_2e03MFS_1_like/PF12832_7/1_9e05MFS_1_like/PF12832_7/9_1MFS_4/PF06779_14/5_5e05MFS_4/PF06779_14/3_7e03MFS_4/PF06779_1